MWGRSSIPLRGTSGHTRHMKIETLPGADTDRHSEHLRAALSHDIVLRDDNIPQLCRSWDNNITDLVSGIPLKLLPIREVNHKINLIDPEKCIHYCLLKCPEHFHEELSQKIERYCRGSIKNKAIFFFNWPPYFFIFSHCLQFQKTQKQEKSRITT